MRAREYDDVHTRGTESARASVRVHPRVCVRERKGGGKEESMFDRRRIASAFRALI
jgi:hypothetical protein